MHLLLTDRLTCPRCGPEFGLILMAVDVSDRRVTEGRLGCFNCREEYPIEGGVGDLRPPPREPILAERGSPPLDDPEAALRLAALLGVQEGPGHLFMMGSVAAQAERVAAMIEDIEVIAIHPGIEPGGDLSDVSRLRIGSRIPLQSFSMRGVALEGEPALALIDEGARILAPGARLVLIGAPPDTGDRLEAEGMELLLVTDRTIVARESLSRPRK
jgi:uncharacterized protein YbaR (Trm112 family)